MADGAGAPEAAAVEAEAPVGPAAPDGPAAEAQDAAGPVNGAGGGRGMRRTGIRTTGHPSARSCRKPRGERSQAPTGPSLVHRQHPYKLCGQDGAFAWLIAFDDAVSWDKP